MLRFPDKRLEAQFTNARLANSQAVSSAAHAVAGFCWSFAPIKLLLVASRECKWSLAVLVVSLVAQILNVVANGVTAWVIGAQGKQIGRYPEFPRFVTLYLGTITTFAVRTLLGNQEFVSIFAFPGTFSAAVLLSSTAVTDNLRMITALPYFLVNFVLGVPYEVSPGATTLATASNLAVFFAAAVALPSAVVVVLEAKERRDFLAPMGKPHRVQALQSPFWARVTSSLDAALALAAAALRRVPAALESLLASVLRLLARILEGAAGAVRFLQFPDSRLESMFNTWKLQQHQSLSGASHATACVCWACGSLKFVVSTVRDGRWNPAVLTFIYFLEAANVGFNMFVSWEISNEGRRTEKTRSERSRVLCVLMGTLTNAAAMATIGAADFQTIFGFPGTFTTATLHSFAVMIDQVRLSSALPLFLVSFASVAPFEVDPAASGWATAHRLLLFFILAVVIPSVVAILLEARERHLFVEFHEDAKIRRLLSPFWRRVIYGVDTVYYAMHSMNPDSDY